MNSNSKWVFESYPEGMPSVDNWVLQGTEIPIPAAGEVLIKTQWLSVDPYMRGRISPAKNYAAGFSPGDTMFGGGIGEVVKSNDPEFVEGDIVTSDYFDWQNVVAISAAKLSKVDPSIEPVHAVLSFLGMPGLTAYFALLHTGAPKSGETVLISAGSGAVGQIAGQIAKIKGLNPVAVVGTDDKIEWCRELGYSAGINHRTSKDLQADIAAACPDGVDIYLDNTAGPIHDAALMNLNMFGRLVVIGTVSLADRFGQPDIGPRYVRQIMINRLRIEGFLLDDFKDRYQEAVADLAAWYQDGLIHHKDDVVEGLDQAPHAFVRMLKGENFGKQLVKL